jgi:hypothetical protein
MSLEIISLVGAAVGALLSLGASLRVSKKKHEAELKFKGSLHITLQRADGTRMEFDTSDPELVNEVGRKLLEEKSATVERSAAPSKE